MTLPSIEKTTNPVAYSEEAEFCRIGLIALATDLTSEHDFASICRDNRVRLHVTRTPYENPVTPENLLAMQDGLANSAALLVPGLPLKAIYFSCTSAGALMGDRAVVEKIQSSRGKVPVITPLSAADSAFETLQVKKLSILTPYTEEVSRPVGEYFLDKGYAVLNISCMGLTDDRDMARIEPRSIVEAAKETTSPEADALFISCTALRAAEVAGVIEKQIKKPVVTSNQAAAWEALRKAGVGAGVSGYGKLLSSLPG
jgi:maleate isomerase